MASRAANASSVSSARVASRLLVLAVLSESAYLVLALFSHLDLETLTGGLGRLSQLGQAGTSPVFLETRLGFVLIWVLVSLWFLAAARIAWRYSEQVNGTFVVLAAALFRLTLFGGADFHQEPETAMKAPLSRLEMRIEPLDEALPPSLTGLRHHVGRAGVAIVFDLVAIALLIRLLRNTGAPSGLALLYAWNPLVIKEVAGNARVEVVGVALFTWSLYEISKSRAEDLSARGLAGAALGFSMAGFFWFAPTAWILSIEMGAGALFAAILGAGFWAAHAGFDWTVLGELVGLGEPVMGSSFYGATTGLSALFVTRNQLIPTIVLVIVYLLVITLIAANDKDKSRHRPPAERWARSFRTLLGSVGGLMFIAPRVLPGDWLALAVLTPFAAHPALRPNVGWLLFALTAPVTYWAMDAGWSLQWSFLQYALPFGVLVFVYLGRSQD